MAEAPQQPVPVERRAHRSDRCATSAASHRSRSITNDFDQIISSTGLSFTRRPSTCASGAWLNHSSSTGTMPLPELKIRSMKASPDQALASQW